MGSLLNTFKSAKVIGDKEYEKAHSVFKEFSKVNNLFGKNSNNKIPPARDPKQSKSSM